MEKRYGITATVIQQLTKRTGQTVYLADLEQWTGLPKKDIHNAIAGTQRKGLEDITTIVKGQAWRYNGPATKPAQNEAQPQPEASAKEEPPRPVAVGSVGHMSVRLVGTTNNGDLIIQEKDGTLWRATKL